jgi:thiamine-monophosphate kinase
VRGEIRLNKIGEFGFIECLAKKIKIDKSVLKGIGDDTAVVKYSKDKAWLLTCDMLVEDVHFKLKEATPFQVGWKALGCSLSDIAAMGGVPKYALISLGLPKNFCLTFIDEIYRGMNRLAKIFKVNIVGGDTNRAFKLIIDVFSIGEAEPDKVVYRDGAKQNDIIAVTGTLGNSYKSKKHLKFMPRIKEARFLVNNFRINSMLDISDGLISDLQHILRQSNRGAVLFEQDIPLSKDANLKQTLSEGEDFELLFTLPVRESLRLAKKARQENIPISFIGIIIDKPNKILLKNRTGGFMELEPQGFRHF